jgi:phosphoenolpyruvate-protein phosphotransferase (PTS system enzyme I)
VTQGVTRRLHGIAASPGVAVGIAFLVDRRRVSVPRRHIEPSEVEAEVGRLETARASARTQLETIRERLLPEAGEHSVILDAHLLMLDDTMFTDQAEVLIRTELINAEWALRRTVEQIKNLFNNLDDNYFRERRSDVDFVGERVLRQLTGAPNEIPRPRDLGGPVVLIAHELSPADTAALARSEVLAFVTDSGAGTSHTAIMARALSIPAVVGVADATRVIATGDRVVVDGLRGLVTVSPSDLEVDTQSERGRRYAAFARSLRSNRHTPAQTRDGVPIKLRANIEMPTEADVAVDHGADGIGLYRTEFLYVDRREPPSEDEQYEVYRKIVETMSPRKVTLRTFDIGGDKFSTVFRLPREMNPALGLRAVRLALRERDVFRTQLRAMLRAARHGRVRIMIPMIATVSELRESKAEVRKAEEELERAGRQWSRVPIGMMVETPSAVLMSDVFARECDFFSVGTNDLIQYSLATDRGNEHVAHLARSLDPSILRSLSSVTHAAAAANIPCALCGAMAGELLALPLLVGMGMHELSVEPSAVPEIKAALARIDHYEAMQLVGEIAGLATAQEVESTVRARYELVFSDLIAGGELGTLTETGTFVLPEFRQEHDRNRNE